MTNLRTNGELRPLEVEDLADYSLRELRYCYAVYGMGVVDAFVQVEICKECKDHKLLRQWTKEFEERQRLAYVYREAIVRKGGR
jgi:hypothetical protein